MIPLPTLACTCIKTYELFTLAAEVSELTLPWAVFLISRNVLRAGLVGVMVGMDAGHLTRFTKMMALALLVLAESWIYIFERFVSKAWSSEQFCYIVFSCTTPKTLYLQLLLIPIVFGVKFFFKISMGREFVVVRPYYAHKSNVLWISQSSFLTQSSAVSCKGLLT